VGFYQEGAQPSLRDVDDERPLVPTLKRWAILAGPSGTGTRCCAAELMGSRIEVFVRLCGSIF